MEFALCGTMQHQVYRGKPAFGSCDENWPFRGGQPAQAGFDLFGYPLSEKPGSINEVLGERNFGIENDAHCCAQIQLLRGNWDDYLQHRGRWKISSSFWESYIAIDNYRVSTMIRRFSMLCCKSCTKTWYFWP